MTVLDRILVDVRTELEIARSKRPASEIRAMLLDAPPPRNFAGALESGSFGLIAEIKKKSPSVGPMRKENVDEAPGAYEEAPIVKAVSILTNHTHFGGSIETFRALRMSGTKPALRKDFLIDEYQIREARAFGADAVLLMANVLDASRLQGFYDLTRELGMEALFEVHTREEIDILPSDARVVGINSRRFKTESGFSGAERASERDFSVDTEVFTLVADLPAGVLRIAESGLSAKNIRKVTADFHAALVGTSLLRDPRGVRAHLDEFVSALQDASFPV
jgi:indole-3-glycerol phosphate synthase